MKTWKGTAPAFAAVAAVMLAGCEPATTERAQGDAKRAGEKIEQALDRTGQKLTEAAQKTGDKLAESNQRLAPKVQAAGEKIGDAAEKTGEKITAATTQITTGEATSVKLTGVSDDTRQKLADTGITASIKASYVKDPDLRVLGIRVQTTEGVVTLEGEARDEAARKRAEQLAQATKGVRQVHNNVAVKPGSHG